jgi:hypothetical protein
MAVTDELARAERRLAEMVNARADSEARERSRDKAERVRLDDLRCKDLAAEYQQDYAAHNATPPLIRSDEWSSDYHRRLLRGLQRRLSPRSDLADPTLFNEISGKTFENFAGMVRQEAAKEAHTPAENLPESVSDPRAMRERTDDMGRRTIEFHAKRSFIADMSQEPQKVLRIMNQRTGDILYGPPMPRMR